MTKNSDGLNGGIVWIDLSDMLHWRGHFTGIQRVVYNLAIRFDTGELDVRFFHFDAGRNAFLEIEFNELESRIFQSDSNILDTVASKPNSIANRSKRYFSASHSLAAKAKRKAKNLVKNSSNKEISQVLFASFAATDIVVVLGGNWDKPGYMVLMKSLKESIGFKFAQMYYDLIPIYDSGHVAEVEHNRFRKYIDDTLFIADIGFAISEHTKRDLNRYIENEGIPSLPIHVIRLGDDIVTKNDKSEPVKDLSKEEYILVVGTLEVRKNHVLIYYALKLLADKGLKLPHVVIAGKPGWLTEDIQYQFKHDPDLRNKITILSDITDSELDWLYKNCKFTLYPSFYEGWGLPVAESLQYGKPCIASNSSSIPEVAGVLLDYHSPFDSTELAKLIDLYFNNSKYLESKSKIIKDKYTTYSWDDTYLQVLNTISIKY